MPDLVRQEVVRQSGVLVVKVGTRVLARDNGSLDEERIGSLAEELCALADSGRRVVLVSSGAVGAGMSQLGLSQRPTDLARLQAVAAIGQARLIQCYDQVFRRHGRHAGQVLLTADDLHDRARYLNVRNTLSSLLEIGAVPVINENDTVAVDELMHTFGDNDHLAALVTNLLRAPLLLILSDVEGLYDRDPHDPDARVLPTVSEVDEDVRRLVHQSTGPSLGRGGMASKLQAARIVTAAGENCIVASGRRPQVISEVMRGELQGTLFLAQGKTVSPWKRWIGFSAKPRGRLLLDDGACRALKQQGTSLLAAGIQQAEGDFSKGDVVSLCGPQRQEIGRGLTNYDAAQVRKIAGLKSDQIAEVLGGRSYTAVVHCDNLQIY